MKRADGLTIETAGSEGGHVFVGIDTVLGLRKIVGGEEAGAEVA